VAACVRRDERCVCVVMLQPTTSRGRASLRRGRVSAGVLGRAVQALLGEHARRARGDPHQRPTHLRRTPTQQNLQVSSTASPAELCVPVADVAAGAVDYVLLAEAFYYKSLFTENSVATQKHSSASINTNKIQYKIQRSSPSQ